MGDPIYGHGEEARIGKDHLVHAFGRRIASFDGGGVRHDLVVDLGQGIEEGGRDFGRVDAQLAFDGAEE